MENQNQLKNNDQKQTQPVFFEPQTISHRPLTDAEAQALLTASHLQAHSKTKTSNRTLKYLLIVVLLAMAILSGVFYIQNKSKKQGANNSLINNTINNPVHNGNGTINQDVQYCSNPINAALSC